MTQIVHASEEAIRRAAALIREGGLAAFPTETVYGLGANALDGRAVARIFEAKGRPAFNPLISHVHSLEQAEVLAVFSETAREAAAHFWPGPLTLILPKARNCPVSDLACAGLATIALRVPAHPVARALLKEAGVPVAAPSANRSGGVSPTTPAHVAESLGDQVDMILAAGPAKTGLESTVLDLSGKRPSILRPGIITAEETGAALGMDVPYAFEESGVPKSPGLLLKHYAPSVPVRLNVIDLEPGEALLAFGSDRFMGVRGGGAAKDIPGSMRRNLSPEGDLYEAAANLFRMLRDLDRPVHRGIAVMAVPETGVGVAINDRLKRAARR